jgi:PTS system mannitol-specific IIA component
MVKLSQMSSPLIQLAGIRLGAAVSSKEEAVRLCGSTLQDLGAVESEYILAMWERENIFPSYMGEGVAIPHGTDESRKHVNFAQLVFVRFDKPVDWNGEPVKMCIGIAAKGDEHNEILGNLADRIMDEDSYKVMAESNSAEEILALLTV